jgi:hypothetical protein
MSGPPYERLLREFVGSENRLLAARTLAELVRYRSKNCASAAGESLDADNLRAVA